jgi:hypothetical protein
MTNPACEPMRNDLVAGDLTLATRPDRLDAIEIVWIGKSNDLYPGKLLMPYLHTALSEAAERVLPIEMRFDELEHFNSSTITLLIQFIQEARQRGVRLAMVYNPAVKWQKLSFNALRVFTRDAWLELRSV